MMLQGWELMGEGLWPGAAAITWLVAATQLCSSGICSWSGGFLEVEVAIAASFGAETLTHVEF